MRLAVELYGTVLGHLEGEDLRTFDFVPSPDGIERFGQNSTVLSVVLPLVKTPIKGHAGRRRNWFAELLPEGALHDYMLAQSALRRGDVPAFLTRYGRDVAGALQIWDADDPTEPKSPSLRLVDDADIRRLLDDPLAAPLANAPRTGRSSLAGVQPKIVLVRTDAGWGQALGGYPTTHILKPRLAGHPTVIFDEEYGSQLARAMGLADFSTHIADFDGLQTLVIERFDRAEGRRTHQEDFSQALGAAGNQKYQEIGGVVSLRRVADTLQQHAEEEERTRLARMVVLSIGVGNLDMHTKNIGLLHSADGNIRLAPAYDIVPQTRMAGGDGKVALSVNGTYRHNQLTSEDLVAEFTSWGLRNAERLASEGLADLRTAVAQNSPVAGSHPEIRDRISRFVDNLIAGRTAGAI